MENHVPRDNKQAKDILLQTPYTGSEIILSESELIDLHHIMEQVENARKAIMFLKLFEV
jgi:hypothetical protein